MFLIAVVMIVGMIDLIWVYRRAQYDKEHPKYYLKWKINQTSIRKRDWRSSND